MNTDEFLRAADDIATEGSNVPGKRVARPAGVTGDRLDDTLSLCFRLLRCGPGDRVLHVSLLVVGKVRNECTYSTFSR